VLATCLACHTSFQIEYHPPDLPNVVARIETVEHDDD
jgi:hypothetical protein